MKKQIGLLAGVGCRVQGFWILTQQIQLALHTVLISPSMHVPMSTCCYGAGDYGHCSCVLPANMQRTSRRRWGGSRKRQVTQIITQAVMKGRLHWKQEVAPVSDNSSR